MPGLSSVVLGIEPRERVSCTSMARYAVARKQRRRLPELKSDGCRVWWWSRTGNRKMEVGGMTDWQCSLGGFDPIPDRTATSSHPPTKVHRSGRCQCLSHCPAAAGALLSALLLTPCKGRPRTSMSLAVGIYLRAGGTGMLTTTQLLRLPTSCPLKSGETLEDIIGNVGLRRQKPCQT